MVISMVQVDYLTSYKEIMDDVDAEIYLWIEADIKILE